MSYVLHKKSVLHKKVTKSHGVTIDPVLKSRIDCTLMCFLVVHSKFRVEMEGRKKAAYALSAFVEFKEIALCLLSSNIKSLEWCSKLSLLRLMDF